MLRRLGVSLQLVLTVAGISSTVLAAGEVDRGRIRELLADIDKGDWQGARRLADGPGAALLEPYVRWRELLERDDRLPFAAYVEFMRANPDWPSQGTLQLRAEDGLNAAITDKARLAFFADRAPRSRQGRQLLAEALLAADRRQEAASLLRQSWVQDDFDAAAASAFLDRFGAHLRPADDSARLDRLLWDGRTDQARRMLGRVGSHERAIAAARIALQESAPDVDRAIAALPAAAQSHAGLLFDRLCWRAERGNQAGVQEILLRPPSALGRPEKWWNHQQRAIRAAMAERSFKLAYRLASSAHQPPGSAHAEAEWLAGWLALRFTGQPKLAAGHFERLWSAVTTPISRARAGYWAGRAAAANGNRPAAAQWYRRATGYPHTFYGQLAADELGLVRVERLPPSERHDALAGTTLRRRAPAQLARLFCRGGQPGAAQPFFRHLGFEAAGNAEELAAAVDLARDCDRADLVLTVTRAAAANGTYLVRDAFPLPSTPAFVAREAGLPEPALLLAVARQESLFNPEAQSPVGAMGLMQLMPTTAKAVSAARGMPFSRSRLVSDPDYNVSLGGVYLASQLSSFDQEPALALAAYNAGPGRVAEWLRLNGDPRGTDRHGLIDWIELIPFAETRNYVQRVLEARDMYRSILEPPAIPSERLAEDGAPTPQPRRKPAS